MYEDDEKRDSDLSDEETAKKTSKNTQKQSKRLNQEDIEIFFNEVLEILERGLKQNLDPGYVILEINSSKHANNIQIDDVCYFVAKAVLYLPIALHAKNMLKVSSDQVTKLDYLNVLKIQLKKNTSLLKNYHTKTKQSQKILLDAVHEFFIESPFNMSNYGSKFGFLDACYAKLMHYFYNDCEILNDAVAIEWFGKQKSSLEAKAVSDNTLKYDLESKRHAVNKLEPFIKWLEESEEEDSDEEDE